MYSSILETIRFGQTQRNSARSASSASSASSSSSAADPNEWPWDWVWTTIKPDQLDELVSPQHDSADDEVFVVIIQLAGSMKSQTRMYCSAERPSSLPADGVDRKTYLDNAERLVQGSVRRYLDITDTVTKFGGVHELWTAGVWEMLGVPGRPIAYDVWIEPLVLGEGESSRAASDGTAELLPERYSVDKGRKEDCEIVRPHIFLRRRGFLELMLGAVDTRYEGNQNHIGILLRTHTRNDSHTVPPPSRSWHSTGKRY